MNPLVSVIMPAFNAERFISNAIDSVLSQTFIDWELIIINDGSTDDTEKIISNYLKQDNRIYYVFQENGKQGKARNRGIRMSRGKYLAFLDADDLWTSKKLSSQIEQIESENLDLIFSDFGLIDENNVVINPSVGVVSGLHSGLSGLKPFFQQNRIPILTVLAKKDAIEKCGLFSEEPRVQNAEDYHLWLKMLIRNCRFRSFSNISAYYRVHSDQNTSKDHFATISVLNALITLDVNDKTVSALRQDAVYRWLIRYFKTFSQRSDQLNPVFHYLSSESFLFRTVSGLIPLFGWKWEKRLMLKFCQYKLWHTYEE